MGPLDKLLHNIALIVNLEEIKRLQQYADLSHLVNSVLWSTPTEALQAVVDDLVCEHVEGCIADDRRTEASMAAGAAAFAERQYAAAARQYSDSLRWVDETRSAARAARLYCNRALSNSRLGLHRRALQDSNCAVVCDPTYAKAFYRRALANQALGQLAAATGDAQRALELQREQSASTKEVEVLLEAVGRQQMEGNQTAAQPTWTTHEVPEELKLLPAPISCKGKRWASGIDEAAALARQVSPLLTVRQSAVAGRELVAAQAAPAGTDVLQETPFVHALVKSHRQTNCAHCCGALPAEGAWYCRRCPVVAYCSPECRAADTFHTPGGPECGVPWPVLLPPDVVLALRLAQKLLQGDAPAAAAVLASLETHLGDMLPEDVVHSVMLAAVAQAAWQQAAQRARAAPGRCELSVSAVLRALCQVHINGLAIVPVQRASEADRIGVGIFPVSSFMNHACIPNVSVRFQGSTLVARTVAPLAPGSALLHCYGPQAGEMTTQQRRTMLEQQYHFTCSCGACSSPPAAEAAMVGLCCTSVGCDGALPVPCAADAGIASKYDLPASPAPCARCGTGMPQAEWNVRTLADLRRAQELYTSGCNALDRVGVEAGSTAAVEAVNLLGESLEIRLGVLHADNQVIGATEDALALACHAANDISAAAHHLHTSLRIAERNYPSGSANAAFQGLKLAAMLQEAAQQGSHGLDGLQREADALMQAALRILQLHFGNAAAGQLQ